MLNNILVTLKFIIEHIFYAIKNLIIPNHYPLTKLSENVYVEGYWSNEENPQYPTPFERKNVTIDRYFINKLKNAGKYIKVDEKIYRGFSKCRICGKLNGAGECSITKNGIKYIYPNGIIHYYEDHGVKPSDEFYQLIINL